MPGVEGPEAGARSASRSRLRFVSFFLAAVLMTLLLRFPYYLKKPFFNVDEGTLAAVANTILDGDLPYIDSWDTRGPVTFYIYAGAFYLTGRNNMLAVHFLVILTVVLSCLFLMLLGRRLGWGAGGDIAGPVYALISFSFLKMDMMAANIEIFMVLFSVIAAYLLSRGLSGGGKGSFFWAGIFLGLAFLTKQPALLDWASLTFFLLIYRGDGDFSLKKRLSSALVTGAGFLIPFSAFTLFIFSRGGLETFIFQFWTYSSEYFLPAMSYRERLRMAYAGPWPMIRDNLYIWITGASAAVWLAWGLIRRRGRAALPDLVLFWGFSSLLAASSSGRGFGHYYIQFLPPLALLSSHFTISLFPRLIRGASGRLNSLFHQGAKTSSVPSIAPRRVIILTVLVALVGYSLPLFKHYDPSLLPVLKKTVSITREPVEIRNLKGFGRNLKLLVNHIQKGSTDEDTVFVWGFYPQIYLLSNRRPATRFSYCIYLTGLVPWVNVNPRTDTSGYVVPGSWDMLIEDLNKTRPLFIVDTAPGNIYYWRKYPIKKFPRLQAFIDASYVLDENIRSKQGKTVFRVYRRVEG